MSAPKRSTHVVIHPKLYMAVEGKLQHVKKGSELILSDKVAKKLGSKVGVMGEGKTIDMTSTGEGDTPDFGKMKVDELKAELAKAGITFPEDAKKADLLELLTTPAE